MFLKRIQLGLIHVALTMTLIPINSALNRVMINDLALSATLVAVLASLWLLRAISVSSFQSQASKQFSYSERAALAGES